MNFNDLIHQFTEDLDFDALKHWCAILGVDYEPPLGNMESFLTWEDKLRTKIAEAMTKVGAK